MVASLVASCLCPVWFLSSWAAFSWIWGWGMSTVMAGVGAVLGHLARRRAPALGGGGYDLALASAIIGWTLACLGFVVMALLALASYLDAGTS